MALVTLHIRRIVSTVAIMAAISVFTNCSEESKQEGPAPGSNCQSASSLGILSSNSDAKNRRALIEAIDHSNRCVIFEAGDYKIDNSGNVGISTFGGTLDMSSGATFVFTDNTKRGISFWGSGRGAHFIGYSSRYETLPDQTNRIDAATGLFLQDVHNYRFDGLTVYGAPQVGIEIRESTNPVFNNVNVQRTVADGLQIANTQNATVNDYFSAYTGDDGLAILNYSARSQDWTGARINGVRVLESGSRGIVIANRDVTVENFYVNGTRYSGLHFEGGGYYQFRPPKNSVFRNGEVHDGGRSTHGYIGDSDDPDGRHGMSVVSDKKDVSVTFENVNAYDSRTYSAYVNILAPSYVLFKDVHTYDSGVAGRSFSGATVDIVNSSFE